MSATSHTLATFSSRSARSSYLLGVFVRSRATFGRQRFHITPFAVMDDTAWDERRCLLSIYPVSNANTPARTMLIAPNADPPTLSRFGSLGPYLSPSSYSAPCCQTLRRHSVHHPCSSRARPPRRIQSTCAKRRNESMVKSPILNPLPSLDIIPAALDVPTRKRPPTCAAQRFVSPGV